MPVVFFQRVPNGESLGDNARTAAGKTPGVELTEFDTVTAGGQMTLRSELTFDDARKIQFFIATLAELQGVVGEGESVPEAVKLAVDFPNLSFNRRVGYREIAQKQKIPAFALPLLGEEAQVRHILHLPTAVKSHNAGKISEDRKTLQWNFPLAQLLKEDAEMAFVAPLPYLKSALVGVALLLFLILFLVARLLRKRRHKLPTEQPETP